MRYKHFNKDERNEISVLLKKGYSIRDIADALGRDPSSVSREIKKNSVNGQYDPRKAHYKARTRRKCAKYQGMKIIEDSWLQDYIEEKMKISWSPETIAGRVRFETGGCVSVHHTTIYKYLYSSYGQRLCRYLRYKHYGRKKRKATKSVREIIKNRVFIDQRPEIINQKERFGDFEGDTLGAPQHTKERLAAFIERKSRYILAKKITQLKYAMDAFKKLLRPIPALSATFDNGPENARHQELGIDTYFCHSYASWEKGSIENALGLIREYIPKKRDIACYTEGEIDAIVETINNRPRKCLGFRTPKEVFEEQFLKCECCTSG